MTVSAIGLGSFFSEQKILALCDLAILAIRGKEIMQRCLGSRTFKISPITRHRFSLKRHSCACTLAPPNAHNWRKADIFGLDPTRRSIEPELSIHDIVEAAMAEEIENEQRTEK